VDRLERAGLVERERADGDGRGIVAVLTQAGVERLRVASGTHLAGVARHFAEGFGEPELEAFGATCRRLSEENA
jgi:DNA-binding MarR family transcriptional regulator